MTRVNQILAGAALAQAALAAVVWWPRGEQGVEAHDLVGLNAAAIDGIDIEGRRQPGDTAPTPISLKKQGDGWVLASSMDFPVETTKVDDLLKNVAAIQVRAPVATRQTSHASLNVADEDHARRITLHAGGQEVSLILGAASGSAAHVRKVGDDAVYAVRGWTPWTVGDQPGRFWDSKLLTLDAATVDSLTVHNPAGSFTLAKNPEGYWTAAGESHPMDQAEVDGLIARLASLRMSEIVGTTPTPDLQGGVRVEWTTTGEPAGHGGLTLGETADYKTTAQVDGGRWVVKVPASSVDRWATITAAELIAEGPPEGDAMDGAQPFDFDPR